MVKASLNEILWSVRHGKRVTLWLLTCGVAAFPLMAAFMLAATVVAPGYSHLTETVSHLGSADMSYPQVMNTGFVTYGLLMMGFGWGLYRFLRWRRGALLTGMLVTAFGVGILLAGVFPADGETGEATTVGLAHTAGAVVAYVMLILAILSLVRFIKDDRHWGWFSSLALGVVPVSMALGITFCFEPTQPIRGLVQRFFYGLPAIYLQLMAVRLLWLGHSLDAWSGDQGRQNS